MNSTQFVELEFDFSAFGAKSSFSTVYHSNYEPNICMKCQLWMIENSLINPTRAGRHGLRDRALSSGD